MLGSLEWRPSIESHQLLTPARPDQADRLTASSDEEKGLGSIDVDCRVQRPRGKREEDDLE